MTSIPIIQVLSKQNFEDQHLVSLPNALPFPPLGPSSLRVQSTLLSLTTNNLGYALIGHIFGWWDVHPLPSSIPAEFSDPKSYGRISAWGYGTVIESTTEIEVGTQVFGYLPIGTLPVDMQVDFDPSTPGRFQEVSEYRSKQLSVYNRYFFPPKATSSQDIDSQAYDSLVRVLFETAYMLNRFVFAWEPSEVVHPTGTNQPWAFEDANIDGATILLFSASGKTALSLAYQLKYGRPVTSKPSKIIAVGSLASKSFTEGTGLYDQVLEYGADDSSLEEELGLNSESKIVIVDFGSRDFASVRWIEKFKKFHDKVISVGVGAYNAPENPEKASANLMVRASAYSGSTNASALRDAAISKLGEENYFDDFYKEWNQCRAGGVCHGLNIVWGYGMEDVGKGWEKLCKGEVGVDQGLVFSLPIDKSS